MQPGGLSEREGGLLEGGWKARYDDNSLEALNRKQPLPDLFQI